jgi:tRNA pseudouridine38-40 synthase
VNTQRIRVDLAYDGTDFHGWAVQPGLRTVQGEVQAALERVVRVPVAVTVAGRTDTGVHARGQVIHADLPDDVWERLPGRSARTPAEALASRLNGVLDASVRVAKVRPVSQDFDARFGALWRRYCYRITDDAEARDPLTRGLTWWSPGPLDDAAMGTASAALLGEHDFLAFCRPREGATTVRTVQELAVQRVAPGRIEVWIQADAFCHHMVRAIVGGLVAVGTGRRPGPWLADVLAARLHDPAVTVLPAHGLTFERVAYPADGDLAAQAARARTVRGA